MKILILIITLFISTNLFPNKIIIKYNTKISNEKFEEYIQLKYRELLGNVKTSNFIKNQKLLESNTNYRTVYTNNKAEEIKKIFVVEFDSKLSPELIISKIKSNENFEYVEKYYERELLFVPNDPDIQNQYYLNTIKAFEAWEFIPANADPIVVAIVDTGIESDHPDLEENIWKNPGETGFDNQGNDKSKNNIDDDGNGYIDDVSGWDLNSGTDSTGEDNNPYPGHYHGTHVGGITAAVSNNGVGIAGTALNVNLLPVKISGDDSFASSVDRGYEGVIYAAKMGAKVINCSWGGSGFSMAEQEIVNLVTEMGSLIVAAAGNSNGDLAFYPASYEGVLSVAATNSNDKKASFSNYSKKVDISAPGNAIYSTLTLKSFGELNGTSMASPIVAGAAAMVLMKNPNYKPMEIIQHLKSSSDYISANDDYKGKIGKGRLNLLNAMKAENLKGMDLFSYNFTDDNGGENFISGSKINLDCSILNILTTLPNVKCTIINNPDFPAEIIQGEANFGETIKFQKQDMNFSFTLPDDLPLDFNYEITLLVESDDYTDKFTLDFFVNKSYINIFNEKIATTLNSVGNLAFNDYPENRQGIGFSYEGSGNLLYEGAMIIGRSIDNVSSNSRSLDQNTQNRDFTAGEIISVYENSNILVAKSNFSDKNVPGRAGVDVETEYIMFKTGNLEKVIFLNNKVINRTKFNFDSLYVGYYFDWDIGESGQNNICNYDPESGIIYQYNTKEKLPHIGATINSDANFIPYALDNDGETENNPGVYDGFSFEEQWSLISGKIQRFNSNETDASMIISAGPYQLNSSDTAIANFIIMASNNQNEFANLAAKAKSTNISSVESYFNPEIYPNPAKEKIRLNISLNQQARIEIYDLNGNNLKPNEIIISPSYLEIDVNNFSKGVYLLNIKDSHSNFKGKFILE